MRRVLVEGEAGGVEGVPVSDTTKEEEPLFILAEELSRGEVERRYGVRTMTKAEKYREKQRARAAAAKERSAQDRAAEVVRLGNEREKNPPLDEARIEERMANLGRAPDTPETEDLARRMNVGRMFDQHQAAESAISRATLKAMMKAKIVADRGMRMPGEEELSPAVRALRERLGYEAGPEKAAEGGEDLEDPRVRGITVE